MIPALLGNIVGGGVFVAAAYWYLYITGTDGPVVVDGSSFESPAVPLFGVNADVPVQEQSRRESEKTDSDMV